MPCPVHHPDVSCSSIAMSSLCVDVVLAIAHRLRKNFEIRGRGPIRGKRCVEISPNRPL